MLLRKLRELAEFLSYAEATPHEVSRFLAQRTFDAFANLTVFMTRIDDNSTLRHIGSFGYPQSFYEKWERFPLLLDVPLTMAVRTGSVVISHSSSDLKSRFKDLRDGIDFNVAVTGWKSCICWPINTDGGILAFFGTEIPSTPEHEAFFCAVGSLVGLWLSKGYSHTHLHSISNKESRSATGDELTERQEVILELLRTGATNKTIALQVGYSESLIRKECISIFRALGISSRNELVFEKEA